MCANRQPEWGQQEHPRVAIARKRRLDTILRALFAVHYIDVFSLLLLGLIIR
jgi:hypothetical protein